MIANTILQQLGGHGFTVMTGSRNYINLGNGLQMSLARNKTSANRLKIILDEDTDTYTMYFYRQTLTKYADIRVKEIAKYEGVYFDMLQQIFTDVDFRQRRREPPYFLSVSRRRTKKVAKKPLFQRLPLTEVFFLSLCL